MRLMKIIIFTIVQAETNFWIFLFMKNAKTYDIAVWSSIDRDKTEYLTKTYFGRFYRHLLFAVYTARDQYEQRKNQYDFTSIPIKRELK